MTPLKVGVAVTV